MLLPLALQPFTTRSAFEAAAGAPLLREAFEGFPEGADLRDAVRLRGFRLRNPDPAPGARAALGPHSFARLRTEGDTNLTVDLVPDAPLRAFGAYFNGQGFRRARPTAREDDARRGRAL